MPTDAAVDAALGELKQVIAARVRTEQRTSQRTKLPNQVALEEAISESVVPGGAFWLAFIEIDKFKSVNDRFGYQKADVLLVHIARLLETMRSCFHGAVTAFHAHGDEFYLLGEDTSDPEAIGRSLDVVRSAIAAIKIPTEKAAMSCTVSVGWVLPSDLPTRALRPVLFAVEKAVSVAKRKGRDRVVRYSGGVADDDVVSLRADCGDCGAKFELHVERSANRATRALSCPNCSASVERAVVSERPSLGGMSGAVEI